MVKPLWKTIWRFLKILKIELAIPHLGIYLNKMKTLIQRDKFTSIFISALFTIAKICKKPRYLSIDKWIKKWSYTYTMKYTYYSSRKKNKILLFVTTSVDLKGIMLNEISQTKKDFTHMWNQKQTNKQRK